MRNRFVYVLALSTVCAAFASVTPSTATAQSSQAPQANWEKLGERQVDGKLDHDVLTVDDGRYTALQFKVEGDSLAMLDIKVIFANGDTFEPNTRLLFDQNTKSRIIDLPGNKRAIKRLVFKYANLPGGGKARLEVWGRK